MRISWHLCIYLDKKDQSDRPSRFVLCQIYRGGRGSSALLYKTSWLLSTTLFLPCVRLTNPHDFLFFEPSCS
jgi:hypothetical protein